MNHRLTRKLAVLAAPVLLAVGGCNVDDLSTPAETATDQPAAGTVAPPSGVQPDSWVTTQIHARFYTDPAVRGGDVDVSTENGAVTLSGTVGSDQARTQAAALARQVDGVTRVDNQLTVADGRRVSADRPADGIAAARKPTTLGDRVDAGWTTTKIQAQYFADADVKGRNIDVTTDAAGTVTLRGRLESEAVREEALRIARQTEGVRRVVDELRVVVGEVTPESGGSAATGLDDAWITAKIQSKYFLDGDVKGRDIDVDTAGGVVTLSGQVDDATERRQVVDIARKTNGVRQVEDRLSVRAAPTVAGEAEGLAGAAGADDTSSAASNVMDTPDSWITTKVQSKFFLSDDLRGESIEVTSARGVVTLRGRVESRDQRRAAEEIARGTKGVRRVENQITVGTASSQ